MCWYDIFWWILYKDQKHWKYMRGEDQNFDNESLLLVLSRCLMIGDMKTNISETACTKEWGWGKDQNQDKIWYIINSDASDIHIRNLWLEYDLCNARCRDIFIYLIYLIYFDIFFIYFDIFQYIPIYLWREPVTWVWSLQRPLPQYFYIFDLFW